MLLFPCANNISEENLLESAYMKRQKPVQQHHPHTVMSLTIKQ